jgi:hypothetical protein
VVGVRCSTGKRPYRSYAEALAALTEIDPDGLGSVYTCRSCGEFHVSRRRFTMDKRKGRGKSRDGNVFRWSA